MGRGPRSWPPPSEGPSIKTLWPVVDFPINSASPAQLTFISNIFTPPQGVDFLEKE